TALIMSLVLLLSVSLPAFAHSYRHKPSKFRTAVKIGAGAAIGAGLGALIGHGRGAAAGALLGGGLMTAHSLARRNSGYGRHTRMIGTIVSGTAIGGGLGAAIGGGKGAGIGALLGGGGSAVWALTRKDLKRPNYQARAVSYRHRSYYRNSTTM